MSDRTDRATKYAVAMLATLGGLGVVGVVTIIGVAIAGEWSRRPEPPRTVKARTGEEVFTVGSAVRVAGSSLVRMTLSTGTDEPNSYSSSARHDERNVLILDTRTGTSRRLLPNNSHRIASAIYLPAQAGGLDGRQGDDLNGTGAGIGNPAAEIFYCFEVERRDNDTRDVVVGRIAGGPAATILTGIEGIEPPWMLDATRAAVIVREQGRLAYRTIDMAAQTISAAVPIEIGR